MYREVMKRRIHREGNGNWFQSELCNLELINSESSTLSKLGKTDKTTSTVRTINGKAISGSLLSKLKEQIAEKEKERYK